MPTTDAKIQKKREKTEGEKKRKYRESFRMKIHVMMWDQNEDSRDDVGFGSMLQMQDPADFPNQNEGSRDADVGS